MSLPVSRRKSPTKTVLAYDLGGTKVEVGAVTARGKILTAHREPALFKQGKKAVLDQLVRLGQEIIAAHPHIEAVGIASAGPLDPSRGLLLDPTNFRGPDGPWGVTPITQILSRRLKLPVSLENDAAAALLAEHWQGAAKGVQNAAILTLGTGLGTAFLANGALVRAGRNLHTEAGHLILRAGDRTARCGCGNLGCAEAYLSGNGFARWVAKHPLFKNPKTSRSIRNPLSALEITERARAGERWAERAFEEMAELLAIFIHNIAVTFCPERVILTGSFAQASDLFLERTRTQLEKLLARRREGLDLLPTLGLSPLANHAGLLGGAFIALQNAERKKSR